MATTNISVNTSTYTQVLSGAGFCYSEDEQEYIFAASQPASTVNGMNVSARSQITGTTGQILWSRCVGCDTSVVFSNPEA